MAAMAAGSVLIAWVVAAFKFHQPFSWYFQGRLPVGDQLITGLTAGLFGAVVVTAVMKQIPFFKPLFDLSRELSDAMNLGSMDILLVASLAGFSEELLFRGVLQPLLGIVITSVIFALIHVGFCLSNRGFQQYAASVFVLGVLLGLISRHAGLPAAMSAHGAWDLAVLLYFYSRRVNSNAHHPKI